MNSQVGEDLVTNPEPHSTPAEILLEEGGGYNILATSNLVKPGQLLMSNAQIAQLRQHLKVIHDHSKRLYNPGVGEPFAMEIEFKITSENILAIKQARPWVFSGAATPSPDRAGTVTLQSTQPRVGAALTATLTDPDGSISNITWQWASSPNGNSNWAPISGAASARYTPVDGDVGNYLRAMASYTDGHGPGKSAEAVSANPVLSGAPLNRSPEFSDGSRTDRSIPENRPAGVNIGAPVTAADADNDTLTYAQGGADARLFSVDSGTGQITVGVGTTLDYEARSSYSVTVSVSDGKDADGNADTTTDDTITVTIHVTDVEEGTPPPAPPPPPRGSGGGGGGGGPPANRAPEFTEGDRTTRSVAENTPAGANIGDPVAATDFNRDTLTYSLRGLGSELFDVDASSGQLLTKDALDYETEASYTVFVWVQDNKNAIGRPDTERDTVIRVAITVANEDEAGAVALSLSEPDVDVPLTAALTDPDGGLARVVWSWERSTDQTAWTAIPGAASDSYTPVAADKGSYLRATASYTDGHGPRKSAQAATTAPVPSNAPPEFTGTDLDSGRGLNGGLERSVAENTNVGEAAGAPVAATDAEGDALAYALGGADAALFTIDPDTGQIRVGARTTLDHEAAKNVYEVTVTATDSLGLSATVAVTIAVTDVGLGSPAGDAYDTDGNEAIDRDEAIAALADYFSGVMTREEAIAVIQLFFAR